jgi:predicted acylesterase/phospholipase RssA
MEPLPPDFVQPSATPPADLRAVSIGIALSGGGYRAAAFHLGTLSYLHRVQLLPQICRLSTVSGGTFIGAKYILSLVEGTDFPDFFRDFYQFLQTHDLIKAGLAELSQRSPQPPRERKLITAMANVYANTFLQDADGNPYTLGQILDADIPVKEVAFNTTEFRTGVAFRFQKSAKNTALIGNGNVSIALEDAKKIRVADIVAASSCFPGGFEPLAFPQDFVWPQNQVPATVQPPGQTWWR